MKKKTAIPVVFSLLLAGGAVFGEESNETAESTATNVVTVTNVVTNAEQPRTKTINPNYIGVYAGLSTGYGLCYRYYDDWGIQIAFLPIVSETLKNVNVGITGFKTLFDINWLRFFVYLGASYMYNYSRYQYYSYDGYYNSYNYTVVNETHTFALGAGPGIEFSIVNRISFDVMFGYGFSLVNGQFRSNLTAEVGAFFRL